MSLAVERAPRALRLALACILVMVPSIGVSSPATAQDCVSATSAQAVAAAELVRDTALPRLRALPRKAPIRTTPANRRTWDTGTTGEWTSGFMPASLWLAYGLTGQRSWLRRAQASSQHLEASARTSSHDVGFMAGYPAWLGWELTGNPRWRAVLRTGAKSLDRHWVKGARAYWSWPAPDVRVIPDSLPNLRLMWQASRAGILDPAAARHAHQHALTITRTHIRPDGSTFHVRDLNRSTGKILRTGYGQGWKASSTWTRGQAWAIVGLAQAARATGDPRLLSSVRQVAQWWLENLPRGCVPWSDADGPRTAHDSSALAVAAVGFWELADADPAYAERWRAAAAASMLSLSKNLSPHGPGVLKPGALRWTARGDREWLPYADYFALEAAARWLHAAPFDSGVWPGDSLSESWQPQIP